MMTSPYRECPFVSCGPGSRTGITSRITSVSSSKELNLSKNQKIPGGQREKGHGEVQHVQ